MVSRQVKGLGNVGLINNKLQRIREDMTLRFQKQEAGAWKLEVGSWI